MGILTPNISEIKLHRSFFEEKTRLLGIPGKIYIPKNYESLGYRFDQDKLQLNPPINLHFIFDSMPSIKTLKNLGWYSEDIQDLPCIAYLPWIYLDKENGKQVEKDLDVKLYSILSMQDPLSSREKKFIIQNVNGNLYYCINWIVKCVPFREEVLTMGNPIGDVQNDGDYKYINK